MPKISIVTPAAPAFDPAGDPVGTAYSVSTQSGPAIVFKVDNNDLGGVFARVGRSKHGGDPAGYSKKGFLRRNWLNAKKLPPGSVVSVTI